MGANLGCYDNNHTSQQTKRIVVRNNLLVDVGGPQWGQGQPEAYGPGNGGTLFQMFDGTKDVVIENNTAFETTAFLVGAKQIPIGPHSGESHSGFIFRNNIVMSGSAGVLGVDANSIPDTLARYFPGMIFEKNVVIGGDATKYPANNFFPATPEAVGFVDYGRGDYRLSNSSLYVGSGVTDSSIR
jgi:hypothetical protein